MDWHHVYPVNDLKEHDTESKTCHCQPRIDWKHQIVIHNAYDLREVKEYLDENPRI